MYQDAIDFLQSLAGSHPPLYALLVVASLALAGLALHGAYSLIFRLAARLGRRRWGE